MAKGTIFKFHNDLDTDQIIASQYLLLPNLEDRARRAWARAAARIELLTREW